MTLSPAEEGARNIAAIFELYEAGGSLANPEAGRRFRAKLAQIELDAGAFDAAINRADQRLRGWNLPPHHKRSRTPGEGYMLRKDELRQAVVRKTEAEALAATAS